MKDLNKFLGVMVGGAIGDALGEPVEFLNIDEFERVDKYYHENPNTKKLFGEWTDDTAMSLIIADSLVRCKGFDIEDQLAGFFKWHKDGWMGLKDYPEGEGVQISKMLTFYGMYMEDRLEDKPWETDLTGEHMDGNGSLMRVGPVPLYFSEDPKKAVFYAGESSKSTHYTRICIDVCKYFAGLIIGAMNGATKEELLTPYYSPISKDYRKENGMAPELIPIIEGSYKNKDRYQINPSGYVVETLEAVLWGFYNSETFKNGMEKTVNLGLDADTTGCIYGYLAGAYYGYDSIPQERKDGLVDRRRIEEYAKKLYNEGL